MKKYCIFVYLILAVSDCSYDKNESSLMLAIEKNEVESFHELADSIANFNFYHHDGVTPLTYFVKSGCHECVIVLIRKKVDVNKVEKGGCQL